ncbi:hypothetical protein Anas_01194 [Armadillidium nasatum]|uniref:Uncharacterized protein n=1 Tax=Armadillidium nasatum TaxID=96803 RepID=A0A5N5T0J5_9CRUS|nr:hypothetical protein Anas_01194 [Armadillidium nasatum]
MLFFPRTLPSTLYKQIKRIEKQEEKPLRPDIDKQFLLHYIDLAKEKQRFTKPSLQRLPKALLRLFTNKIWVGNNFNTVMARC